MAKVFTKTSELPYSRRWIITKVKDCQFFAIKIDGWFVYSGHLQRIKKKTHKLTSCR